jgi:hypothetical protein
VVTTSFIVNVVVVVFAFNFVVGVVNTIYNRLQTSYCKCYCFKVLYTIEKEMVSLFTVLYVKYCGGLKQLTIVHV